MPSNFRSAAGRLLVGVALVALALGCGNPDSTLTPVANLFFPEEKSRNDFPGRSYPESAMRPSEGTLERPVWFVGLDGLTWDLLQPWIDEGALPNFARLQSESAYGTLLSEEPTISPALWATLATGVPRYRHGVVNFVARKPNSYETQSVGPQHRKSPAIWNYVEAAGGRSAVISWFGSYPAESIEGHYLSKGFDPAKLREKQVHPARLVTRLKGKLDVELRPQDVEQIAKTPFLLETLTEDARTLAAFHAIQGLERHDFLAVYFSGIDVVQHTMWKHWDPTSQIFTQDAPADPQLAGVIPAYYRFIDDALGQIMAKLPDDAALFVLSDHGAGPIEPRQAFHLQLEVLLESLGLVDGTQGRALAISELYRAEKRIWLNLEGTEPNGTVKGFEAQHEASRIAARLGSLRTDTGTPLFASIEDHTNNLSWRPGQAALTVRFSDAALTAKFAVERDQEYPFDPVRLRHTDVSGGHRLEGVLFARGAGIATGPLAYDANIYQIAPSILHALGLPQDRQMLLHAPADGGVHGALFAPDWLEQRPITMVREYAGLTRDATASTEDAPDPAAEEKLERLRGLGYVR